MLALLDDSVVKPDSKLILAKGSRMQTLAVVYYQLISHQVDVHYFKFGSAFSVVC